MREIKFRFYSNITKKMYTEMSLIGLQYRYNDDPEIYDADKVPDEELGGTRVQKYSDGHLMQFTGLKDVEETPIFEGDIISFTIFDHNGSDTQYKGVVKWDNAMFEIWRDTESKYFGTDGGFVLAWIHAQDDCIEVIGNIYENPELLEG